VPIEGDRPIVAVATKYIGVSGVRPRPFEGSRGGLRRVFSSGVSIRDWSRADTLENRLRRLAFELRLCVVARGVMSLGETISRDGDLVRRSDFVPQARRVAQDSLGLRRVAFGEVLLELSLLALPNGQAFLGGAGPVFEVYERGDHEGALAMFLAAVSGLEWAQCQALLDERLPDAIAQSVADAHTFFGIELPSLAAWNLTASDASRIRRPVLSVLGSNTQPLWVEVAEFLRTNLPRVEDCTIQGAGHLLHIQRPQPVAFAIAEFLRRNSMAAA
jgi:pimeloyl-ACP methyl ester carboxylesterase